MKITILNGNDYPENDKFDAYLDELKSKMKAASHEVTLMTLRDMNIRDCTGCWNCWWATPGQCSYRDDSHEVCRSVIRSDFTLMASPLTMGFVSVNLKRTNDKLIPLIHPYLAVVEGELHHRKRYDRYPVLGLLLEKAEDTDEEDLEIVRDMYRRLSLNFRSKLAWTGTTDTVAQEVADAIGSL